MNSQSVKAGTTVALAPRGYDAGKKINGRKRHLLTDTLKLLLAVPFTPASTTDRDAARTLLPAASKRLSRLSRIWAYSGYRGHLQEGAAQHPGLVPDVIRRCDDVSGFQVLPRRWAVEKSFARLLRSRHQARDYERRTDTREAVTLWPMTMLTSRRLAAHHPRRVPARAACTGPVSPRPAGPVPPAVSAEPLLPRRARQRRCPTQHHHRRRPPSTQPIRSHVQAAAINAW